MKSKLIAFMLGIVIMMAPVLASADYYTDRTAWELAVASYAGVTVPTNNLTPYQKIDLPLGDSNFFNINVPLTYVSTSDGDFYRTDTQDSSTQNYYANGAFYHSISSWESENIPVSAFGFDMVPMDVQDVWFIINLYTLQGDVLTQEWVSSYNYSPKFFGWVGYDVISFSTWSPYYHYALGNFVQGTTASVPEPLTIMLLGFGLIGLAGLRRKV